MAQEDNMLARVKELVLLTCGFALEMGRERTLLAGLDARMTACGVPLLEEYHALLLRDAGELNALVQLLTVNETYFFREPAHLDLMAGKLAAELLSERTHRPLRIVSAGCSTGEEPYSIAIKLSERFGAESRRLFAITGVDIDASAIAQAKEGIYRKGSFRGMEPGLLAGYFDCAGPGAYRIRDGVRDQVSFDVVNLLGAFHPQGMYQPDIIFYRNVSIYFPPEVQRTIFLKLAGLLSEGGYLVVGSAETIPHDLGVLSLVERDGLFFYRKSPGLRFEDRRRVARNEPVPAHPGLAYGTRPAHPAHPEPRRQPPTERRAAATSGNDSPQPKRDFDSALDLARQGKADQALSLLDTVIEREPSFTKALILKGSLLLNAARFEEAATCCDQALARDPLCLEAYLMLGMVARHRGDHDAGGQRFREAIYLDASCWLAHFYSAEILFARKDARRARTGYQAALRILEKGTPQGQGRAYFPLTFNADEFMVICRHKLSLLKENG